MEVSKFIIDGNDVFVKDAQARDSITTLSDNVTTAQNTADRAEGKADYALNGLATKQDASSALKYDRISKEFTNITISANGSHTFQIPFPDGVTNPRPIYARNKSGTLVIVNMYVLGNDMYIQLKNTSDTPIIEDQTVEVTFLYN